MSEMLGNGKSYVTSDEFQVQGERVDALIGDVRKANLAIGRLDAKVTGLALAQKEQGKVQGEHSRVLADIAGAIVRIETSLSSTAATATRAETKAERASFTNETDRELAALVVEEKKDSIEARRARRQAVLVAVSSVGKWAAAGLTPLVVLALVGRACGVTIDLP